MTPEQTAAINAALSAADAVDTALAADPAVWPDGLPKPAQTLLDLLQVVREPVAALVAMPISPDVLAAMLQAHIDERHEAASAAEAEANPPTPPDNALTIQVDLTASRPQPAIAPQPSPAP